MSLEFTKPKIVKGFMGALIENIDLPDEYRLVKSKSPLHIGILLLSVYL